MSISPAYYAGYHIRSAINSREEYHAETEVFVAEVGRAVVETSRYAAVRRAAVPATALLSANIDIPDNNNPKIIVFRIYLPIWFALLPYLFFDKKYRVNIYTPYHIVVAKILYN